MSTEASDQEPWPVWIVGALSVPAQVWIRQGLLDPDLRMPGSTTTFWCGVLQETASIQHGMGSISYHAAPDEITEGISAAAKRRGHAFLRAAWMAQVNDQFQALRDALVVLNATAANGSLLDLPRSAGEVEDAAGLLADMASRLAGWIAIEDGPVDPLCLAYDAAGPSLIGGIGGLPHPDDDTAPESEP